MNSGPLPEDAAEAARKLVLEYLGVADALARRFRSPGHDAEDLRQVARLGLLKAAHRYREDLGPGFVQFAAPTITGELKRYLRDQSWAVRPPRSLQELRLRINAQRQELTQRLGHEPSADELALAVGAPASAVVEAQAAAAAMVGRPLEGYAADGQEQHPLSAVLGSEDPGYERVEDMSTLGGALSDATEADKRLLHLRFVEEMTQGEIALELGISQMQVSRLLRRLLDRLRERMCA